MEKRPKEQGERVALVLQRPDDDALSAMDKTEKYNALKHYNSELRDSIITWLKENDLLEDVVDVGEPTVFGILFVTTRPEFVDKLAEAPGVLSASISPEFSVGFPERKEIVEDDNDVGSTNPEST
jgi:hypothetical protein